MIRINQLKLPVDHEPEAILKKAARLLKITPEEIRDFKIRRRSLDARKKPDLYYSYTVDVTLTRESAVLHKVKSPQISSVRDERYRFPVPGQEVLKNPPVIVGTGPAGLFCGLMLARNGYCPVLLEQGDNVDKRRQQVDRFWKDGTLNPRSNVQFGEGGAGTFSDGKLNTLVKDTYMRNTLVLELFHEFGADAGILYDSKPHVGTDVLAEIVKSMRQEIERLGGSVRFGSQMTDIRIENGNVCGVLVKSDRGEEVISTQTLVLAVGHSARDTFEMLLQHGVPMDPKSFAVGLRIQHPQRLIDLSQYGRTESKKLGAASYKLTCQTAEGRGVYSFCMCPGGYVVDSSSEAGKLAVNVMSYHARAGENANSALIVTVTPKDFPEAGPLGGIAFQRRLEERAFKAADGKIPLQLYKDYCDKRISKEAGDVEPQICGRWEFGDVRSLMPESLNMALMEAMGNFGRMIHGFDRPDSILAGIESRTSSPVRIWRNETLESEICGLYPCGEGAGYAGGITSAAMDGIKVAEAIACRFKPLR